LGQERISNAEATIRALNLERPRTHAEDPIKKIQLLVRLDRGEAPVLISELEAQAKQTEQNAETKHLLAIAYHQSGNQQKALQNYEAALELDARRPGINRDLGRLYIQMGELRLAREAVNRAINAEPKDALNYLYLGELSEKESSLRDAAGAYLNAHHLAPLWPEPLQRLGTVYGKINRLGDAYYYLGRSLLLQEEDETALVQWERALKVFGEKTPRGQALKAEIDALRERRS
jgi:tetratricopeptide (TPR) repeat protein